jgi:uncharacterized protein
MAVTPTYPGVYIQEAQSAVHPITGVATSIGAFVGYTARGIDNRAEHIYSFADYERLFGGLAPDSEVSYAVQQFFNNGGTEAYVVRAPRANATDAGVVIGSVVATSLDFSALSSGLWANGELILDVDYNGLAQLVVGMVGVTGGSKTVTGTGTSFTTALQVSRYLVFASDPNQTPYEISAVASDTSLTLAANYGGTTGSTIATVTDDPTAFNLTVTNLLDDTVETFPNVSLNNALNNYITNVVNDIDNGSQLVNLTVNGSFSAAPPQSGIVGTPIIAPEMSVLLGGSATVGTVGLTNNSTAVTGLGTAFTTALKANQWVVFASDPTQTPYQISAITDDTHLTLASEYTGATIAATSAVVVNVLAGTLAVTNGSATVAGTSTTFTTSLKTGQLLLFASDTTNTLYQVNSIASDTSLTLGSKFTGTSNASTTATVVNTSASQDAGIQLSVKVVSPASPPSPLPISIKVFANGAPMPQTIAGLAAQLQRAVNGALAVQMPNASVQCSVSGVGNNQAIRVNAMLPQYPDAVLTISTPATTSGLFDVSGGLGLNPPASANVAHYALGTGNANGSQISSSAGSDGTGLPDSNSLIGDPGLFHGIYALDKVDIFNLLCIPEATRAAAGNPAMLDSTVDPNAIYSAAISFCDSKRAFLLIDCPPYVNTPSSAVDWISTGLTVSDENGAAFFPRLRLPDPLNDYNMRTFAPCGVVAGLYARIDASRGVWKAPAGIEASLSGVQSLVYKLSDAENGTLNPLGLNCFRTFPVYKSVLWGARTLLGADAFASQWKYVPVRRVALFLESSLYNGTQWVVFEPNDEPLWSAIRLNVGSFMQNLFIQGYFQGQTPAQAYFVKCDDETTTQTDIDNGIVNIVVGFAPLEPAEFVIIQIQQMTGQTSS